MARYQLPEGYSVTYHHDRELNPVSGNFEPKGGFTVATILNEQHTPVVQGIATCSNEENYNKRIGREIALGRALKELYSPERDGMVCT